MKYIDGQFRGCKDFNLYYQGWLPPGKPKSILIVVHGLAEHSGRYTNLINHFVPRGNVVFVFDCRGHGRSDGLRGYAERFSYYLDDLRTFFNLVRDKYRYTKIFIVGHSVGGTIATAYATRHQDEFDGLILSGATLKPGVSLSPTKIMSARLLSVILPKIGVDVIDASAISRDQLVVDAYVNDPLVYHGKIRARLGAELVVAMQKLPGMISQIRLPILILHGTADRLSDPAGSKMLYEQVSSDDKTLKLYEGFYHEVFNEPGQDQVLKDMETWLATHI